MSKQLEVETVFTKLGVVPLVQEDLALHFLDHNVPGVLRPTAHHQRGQDGVGGKDIGLWLGSDQFPDDGVVGGGDGVEDSVDPLQGIFVLDVDSVIGLVVLLHSTTTHQVLGLLHRGQGQLAQLGLLHLLDNVPVWPDGDRGLSLLDLHLSELMLTTSLLHLPLSSMLLTLSV